MNARDYFQQIAERNLLILRASVFEICNLWNAVVSLNSVCEWVALDRLGYATVDRKVLDSEANGIRKLHRELSDLLICANTLKHVRSHKKQARITTSTGWERDDSTTWTIEDTSEGRSYDVVEICDRAYQVLRTFPELQP